MVKRIVKSGIGDIIDVGLTGIALGQVGSGFRGNLAPIGRATQNILGVGLVARSAKRNRLL